MKIMVIGTTNAELFRFRGDLMRCFVDNGHSVIAIGNDKEYIDEIKKLGVTFKRIKLNNNRMNFVEDIKYIKLLKQTIKEEAPDMIFSYTIKPVLYSAITTRKFKNIKLNVMFAGLGRIFTSNKLLNKILRKFLMVAFKKKLKHANSVIFQNIEDRNLFVEKKVVKNSQSHVVNGSGINVDQYPYLIKEKNHEPVFLHAARLMPQKGILLFLESAAVLKRSGYKFKAVVAGNLDKSFSKKDKIRFFELIKENNFSYLGKVKNIRDELSKVNYVVYPSFYGEGVPRALLESLSCGKPVITSNRPGCKETVTNDNGWMIENYSVDELVKIMKVAIDIDAIKYQEMCVKSRVLAEQKFDVRLINDEMIKIMGIK